MLTLPPAVGRKYIFLNTEDKKKYECEITGTDDYQDTTIYRGVSDSGFDWWYWSDGEAKISSGPPRAILIEDVPLDAIEEIRAQRDAMMQKLADLQTPPRKEEI